MTKIRALYAALGLMSLVAIAASAYALHARDSAIRGWERAFDLEAARQSLAAELVQAKAQAAPEAIRALRLLVLRDAGYPETGEVAVSRAIRDYIYSTNKVGSGIQHGMDYVMTYANLGRPGHEQLCGGMAAAYHWALGAVGIPSRIVQLAGQAYLDGDDEGATHVTVEAYIGGEWRVSDPTFNTEFRCSSGGGALAIDEMQACLQRGGRLVPAKSATQIDGRRLEDYYLPYEALTAAFSRSSVSTAQIAADSEQAPSGWVTQGRQ